MVTLKAISDARKIAAKKLALDELGFLPNDVQYIYVETNPLTFYAIDVCNDYGLLWACDGAIEIPEFIPLNDFVEQIRGAVEMEEL